MLAEDLDKLEIATFSMGAFQDWLALGLPTKKGP
jgi:hypothetical protein